MRDFFHRRKPLSLAVLMLLLVTFVVPLAPTTPTLARVPSELHTTVAPSDHTPAPTSVTLVGSLQSELGCAGDWDPACAAAHMTYDADDDVWQLAASLPAGTYEFKAALNDTWDENYGAGGVAGGDNIAITVPSTATFKFYYDHTSHWITSALNSRIATAVGSFQSEAGCPGDWSPDCLRTWMQDVDGDGTYAYDVTDLPLGAYEFKVAINETWDENYGAGGVPGGDNIPFNVTQAGQTVHFRWDSATNVPTVSVESAQSGHDNNVEYFGLGHNSQADLYRTPFGAVPYGTPVTLRFRTYHNDVTGVKARFYSTATNSQLLQNMTPAAVDVPCDGDLPSFKTCDYWTTTVTPTQRTILYYRFIVTDGTATAYYEDDARYDGGWGEALPNTFDRSYNIYAYEPGFTTPDWAKNAVIYQIFVERFRNGDQANDPTDDPATDQGWFYPTERGHRFPVTPWNTIVPDPEPYSDLSNPWHLTYSSTMYGGDLQGVTAKLDYLQQLGVTTIYLNPIFDSPSNHKYDGRTYREVDPAFGGDAAFDDLVAALDARGMYLVLDAVPNHVSSDSPYFDRFQRHAEVGACESVDSPYRSWFFFEPADPPGSGVCAGDTTYRGWFGVETLPQINTANPEVLSFWFADQGSGNPNVPYTNTVNAWLDRGADGWRVDVVPDIVGVNPNFFKLWRSNIKAEHPDAMTFSETWSEGDVSQRVLGDEFDSTMNYRFRKAVLGFGRDTRWVDNDGGQEVDPLSPSGFVKAFMALVEDYPAPTLQSAMNLLDSHDTNRALHVLNELGFTGTGSDREPVDGFAEARERLKLVSALQMTLPGAPTIYYGDEVGLTGFGSDVDRDDPYNRQPYPWSDQAGYAGLPSWRQAQPDLLAHYQSLTAVRNAHSFLRTGSFDPLFTDDANGVLVFGRKDASGAAIVVLNQSTTPQTVTLDLAGYIPTGTVLDQAIPVTTTNAPISATSYQFSVGSRGFGIWVTPNGTQMDPPAAPSLTLTAAYSTSAALDWSTVADADSYHVYRSFVSGGGYELISTVTGSTSFTDTNLMPATSYYYVVKAVKNGVESAPSNEVHALPAYAIDWANLQWPTAITHTISTLTPTESIYGRIYIADVTSMPGATPSVIAEVGYGPDGSMPAGNASWSWFATTFNTDAGNNDEFQGTLLPNQVGTFDYAYRYSTDNGTTWVYADLDGITNGYDPAQAGDLTVLASSDTTAPSDPTNLREVSRASSQIVIAWDASSDPDVDHYEVWRDSMLFDTTPGTTTVYTDTDVTLNTTYAYKVRAVDTSFNYSGYSNEIDITAEQRPITVTFRVKVPAETPDSATVYIAGNDAGVFGAQWNPGAQAMTQVTTDTWEFTTTALEGTQLQYKYTRGSWDKVEWWGTIVSTANRSASVTFGNNGVQLIDDTATDWGTGPDEHKAVQRWRDPLVLASSSGGTLPISVTWATPITPTGALTQALTLTGPSGLVDGTVMFVGPDTLVFTPTAPLADGVYTVSAFNVRRADIGDTSPMQSPYTWQFTVGNVPTMYKVYFPVVLR